VINKISEAKVPTEWGQFIMAAYAEGDKEQMPHIAMVAEGIEVSSAVTVRIHSECIR